MTDIFLGPKRYVQRSGVLADAGAELKAFGRRPMILADDLGRVAEAVETSRWTMRIARQSIWAGLGMSGAAMVVAAAGYIPPIAGAVLQEVIDIAVRAARPGVGGLTQVGRDGLAHEIARNDVRNVVSVFESSGTLWEHYAPESAAPGDPARRDFVGPGGLPPPARHAGDGDRSGADLGHGPLRRAAARRTRRAHGRGHQ